MKKYYWVLCTTIMMLAAEVTAATFTVTNVNDTGAGSLAAAISNANVSLPPNTINFAIPPFDGLVKTISLTTALPDLTNSVVIDGYSQPGSSSNTLSTGNNAVLLIELQNAGAILTGLQIGSSNVTVRGLVVNGFRSNGINVGGSSNVIAGNFIGTTADGTSASPNGMGIALSGIGNRVGGTAASDRNLISGNGGDGIAVYADSNQILGNYIGTDRAGTSALANAGDGINLDFSSSNVVGQATSGGGNVIAGNSGNGVRVSSGTASEIYGNYIGVDSTGTNALGNTGYGVYLEVASSNIVGGVTAAARNIISGNGSYGIYVYAEAGNQILGNYIGTDRSGSNDLGNASSGIFVESAISNSIGLAVAGAGNVIAGNQTSGIELSSANANQILGNRIGTDATGTRVLSNSTYGIYLGSSSDNLIGGTNTNARNIISGNFASGLYIASGTGNQILGNFIGTDVVGTHRVPNYHGIDVGDSDNLIGGTNASAGNLVSGNLYGGIYLNADRTTLQGNLVGTDINGTAALSNGYYGIVVVGVRSNTIGGSVTGAGNLISGNNLGGVLLVSASFNQIQNNLIGTDLSGTNGVGNIGSGVDSIYDGDYGNYITGNLISNNAIAFNASNGVVIAAAFGGSESNRITENSIFTNGLLGIDLGRDGVSAIQVAPTNGPNAYQNYPTITSATFSNNQTRIQGNITDVASTTTMMLEYFASRYCDPTGYGEGESFIGRTNVTIGLTSATFDVSFPTTDLSGQYITATATRTNTGNTSEFSLCRQVPDQIAPSISTCAPSRTGTADLNCQAPVPDFRNSVVVTDNVTASNALTRIQVPAPGTLVGSGTTPVTITIRDAATNSTSCVTFFTVNDTTAPSITTCASTITTSANVNCQAVIPDFTAGVSATDNCTALGALTKTQSPIAGTLVGLGTTPITITVRDAASNQVTCVSSFIVVDATAPVITECPFAVTNSVGTNCLAAIPDFTTSVVATDSCTAVGALRITQSPVAGSLVGVGTTPVTVTVEDAASNRTTCATFFTARDTTAPVIACPATLVVTGAVGSVSNRVTFATPVASDNCGVATNFTLPASNSFFAYGTTTVQSVAIDLAGNTGTCSFAVIVINPNGPDLTGSWLGAISVAFQGRHYLLGAFQVFNQGNQSASNSVMRVYRSSTSETNNGVLLSTRFNIRSLSAGESNRPSVFGVVLPEGANPTNQHFIAVIDSTGRVRESDESNNLIDLPVEETISLTRAAFQQRVRAATKRRR